MNVREKTIQNIALHENTIFSDDDWRAFFDVWKNPQEPTARIKKAANKYNMIVAANGLCNYQYKKM